mmetsp:Transcript_26876/g.40358  ORF Transcript_26876/g.40358 Transcript_26876/m.40358 type:complete len:83 (+) Transcript_26876:1104-1352(+)
MMEEDEMAYLEDDNEGWKTRNQVQKTPQENTQRGKKRAFWGGKDGEANSENSSRTIQRQENKAVSSAPRGFFPPSKATKTSS